MKVIKVLRRTIIVVCILFLMLVGAMSMPKGKYYDQHVKDLVKSGQAEVIEIGQKINVDGDRLVINRAVKAGDEIYFKYTFLSRKPGNQSFSSGVSVLDEQGNQYSYRGETTRGNMFWGSDGLIMVSDVKADTKEVTIKLDLYDHHEEIKVSIAKEAEADET